MRNIVASILIAGAMATACQPNANNTPDTAASTSTVERGELNAGKSRIVYVNTDSLLLNYELAVELRKKLTEETIALQTELGTKERKLYGEVEELKRQARSLSQFEGELRQKKLIEDEQALLKLQETYSNRLVKLEQEATLQVDKAIEEFLDKYCMDKPIDLVLSYSKLGLIRWSREGHDITSEVLEELNKEYAERQKTEDNKE